MRAAAHPTALEDQLQAKLNLPVWSRRRRQYLRCNWGTRRIEDRQRGAARHLEHRMIHHIEDFGAKLYAEIFPNARDCGVFHQGEIDIIDSLSDDRIPLHIAECRIVGPHSGNSPIPTCGRALRHRFPLREAEALAAQAGELVCKVYGVLVAVCNRGAAVRERKYTAALDAQLIA